MTQKKVYAYIVPGGRSGIAESWPECEKLVKGTPNARYRGFSSRAEAEAWLRAGAVYESRPPKIRPKILKGIYFDAGTGRGKGVEVSVTDEKGQDLLPDVSPRLKLNRHHKLPVKGTNNYGELLGAKYALELALHRKVKNIFGDSKLIVNFWSKGYVKEDLPARTRKLAAEVAELRREHERAGGRLDFISGDFNPADLGFHRR